ncbi:MAG: sodium-dependent transporter [Bacteroidales bacterium]
MSRDNFGSRFGVLVAMAGSAVGLGNLWRFPYLVGTNGGAAFIIIYLVFVFLLCIPIMYAEFIIGRRSEANAFGAFRVLAPGSKWSVIGLLGVFAAISILAFYSVVGGWTIDYIAKAFMFKFDITNTTELETMFSNSVSSTFEPILYMSIFLILTGLIVIAGVKQGIEKYTKLMMPLLFFLVIIIAVRSVTLPNSMEGLSFLFKPDFSKVTASTFLDALGQAFFSLSLGCGCILTYGSYVKKDENIVKTSVYTSVADTLFAIIAGLAIMPAVFSFGISPSEGPGLVFVTLPLVFAQIPMGGLLAILFFFILFFAAITSSISLLEVIVAYMIEELKIKRIPSVIISLIFIFFLSSLCSLSQGTLADVKILGVTFFDFFDGLSANVLMPVGGFLTVVFVGWRLGKANFKDEITSKGYVRLQEWFVNFTYFTIKYIAPIVISVILVRGFI